MSTDENERVIDIVGYLQHLWAHKVTFFVTFVLVLGLGAGWTLTRPPTYNVTQTVMVTLPTVETEAQAMQQSASLAGTVSNYVKIASLPIVASPVLKKFPEIINLEQLRLLVSVSPVGPLAIDLKASGEDQEQLQTLVSDMAQNWVSVAPEQLKELPNHLRFALTIVDEPVVTMGSRGRLIRLAASGVLALIAATGMAAIASAVAQRRVA